ncbi:MAG: carboxypeptidase-like regulatory domain-containing protein [Cyclobacteriaceae bacterium]
MHTGMIGPVWRFRVLGRFQKLNLLFFSILLIINFSTTWISAQSRIEGQVKAENGDPLPFANVLLLHASDSSLAKGVVTNSNGEFVIEDVNSGNFFIVGSMVGYKKTTMQVFEIFHQKEVNMAPLVLAEETVELAEVMVDPPYNGVYLLYGCQNPEINE